MHAVRVMAAPRAQSRPGVGSPHAMVDSWCTLATLIADEASAAAGDIRPWVVANALMGVNRGMISAVRRHALVGHSTKATARRVLAEGRRAFDLLEFGLTEYDPRPGKPVSRIADPPRDSSRCSRATSDR